MRQTLMSGAAESSEARTWRTALVQSGLSDQSVLETAATRTMSDAVLASGPWL